MPFVARALLLVGLFALAFRNMFDLGFAPRPLELGNIGSELRTQTEVGIRFGWRHPGMRLLMLSGMVRGATLSYAFYAMQPYMLELLESDQIWVVGVITAFMSLSTIAGNQLVEYLTRSCRRRSTIILGGSLTTSVGLLGMGLTDTFAVAVGAFLLATTSMGVITPVRQAYVHHVAPSEQRATVISFDAMIGSIGGTGGQLGLGRVADGRGFAAGYVVGGVLSAIALPLIAGVRRIGGEPDRIEGSRARKGTCPQGLPRDAHVESHPREVLTSGRLQ